MDDVVKKAKQFLQKEGYTVQNLLGEGSFGRVYKAHDYNNNISVAIKVIKPQDSSVNLDINKTIQEFLNCQRPNSEHIVKIEKVLLDSSSSLIFVIQEYCSKGNLTDYMKNMVKTESTLKQIFIQILKGVIAIHEQNIIHSDLKPDNILVSGNNVIKIADFGEAKQLRQEKGATHTAAQGYSPLFAAPEVNLKKQISKESDYYSVGAVFCLLCGLSLQDLHMIQGTKLPNIANHKFKYFIILALNMMTYEPKKRASCQRILNTLQNQVDFNKKKCKKEIEQMTTECNEEALQLIKNNYKQVSQQVQNQQLLNKPINCQTFYLIFWILSTIIPLVMIGIQIYYYKQSCLLDLFPLIITLSLIVFYFSLSSFYLIKNNFKMLRIHNIVEILSLMAYSLFLFGSYTLLKQPFPCDDLYICTDWIDLKTKMVQKSTSDQQLDNICYLQEPSRREQMEQYFQTKYSQNVSIDYYENSFGYLPYIYLGSSIFFSGWILLRMLITCTYNCSKICKK